MKYKLAQLAAGAYDRDLQIPGYRYRGDLSEDEIAVYEYIKDPSKAVVSFRGTDPNITHGVKRWWGDISNDVLIATGQYHKSSRVRHSIDFVKALPYSDIKLVGHSLGGATSELVGAATGLESHYFMAGRMPWATSAHYGHHYFHRGDIVSAGVKHGKQVNITPMARASIKLEKRHNPVAHVFQKLGHHDLSQFIGTETEMKPVDWDKENIPPQKNIMWD